MTEPGSRDSNGNTDRQDPRMRARDRNVTGGEVNSRTEELKRQLLRQTEQLERKYVEGGKPRSGD